MGAAKYRRPEAMYAERVNNSDGKLSQLNYYFQFIYLFWVKSE